jgi:hypothetical protein
MPASAAALGSATWELPPLILHPFNERIDPAFILKSSQAALMLAGLAPGDGSDQDELRRRLMAGRYAEVRMLFFLGKDVWRWIEQCEELVEHTPDLHGCDLHSQSFAGLLTANPPVSVKKKLITWGVADYASLFSRGIGLKAMFATPPSLELLTPEFLSNYHRYADALYRSYMDGRAHRSIAAANFQFDLYASGEYSRLLESQWGEV